MFRTRQNKKVSGLGILKNNVECGIRPFREWSDGRSRDGYGVVSFALLFPVVFPIGVLTRSFIDYMTREALEGKVLDKLIQDISTMPDAKLDKLISGIQYAGSSRSSVQLKKDLAGYAEEIKQEIQDEISKLESAKYNEKVEAARTELNKCVPKSTLTTLGVTLGIHAVLTPEEKSLIAEQAKIRAETLCRIKQRHALIEFLCTDKNAGKRMEHEILNSANTVKSMQPR